MATAFDFAAYFHKGSLTTGRMQIQKLLYYVQCWSLAWTGEVAFDSSIQAWSDGPVERNVWAHHRYAPFAEWQGNPSALSPNERAITDAVASFYGKMNGAQLRALTHSEEPWIEAWSLGRNTEISPAAMLRYYSKKASCDQAIPERPILEESHVDDDLFAAVAQEQMIRWQETLELLAR